MFRVLFVCTGNICRSPMAEGILSTRLRNDLVPDVEVFSAGTYAQDGAPASAHAVRICGARGIDIASHSSRLLHGDLVREADLVLAMEAGHVYDIQRIAPDQIETEKVQLLGGFNAVDDEAGVDFMIFDPIGGSEDDYLRCFAMIDGHVERSYPAIRALISERARKRNEGGAT